MKHRHTQPATNHETKTHSLTQPLFCNFAAAQLFFRRVSFFGAEVCRMKCLKAAVLLLVMFGGAAAQGEGRGGGVVSGAEAARWREDLRYMAEEMPKRHKNLFHTMTREQFDAAVRALDERIPRLARHEIIVELARIAALVGDGHTNVAPTRDPKIGFRSLPVSLYLFKDGLFVRAAAREQAALVGARVLKIGNLSAADSIARAGEVIGRDNQMGVKFFAPHLLTMPEVLHALRITDALEEAPFVLEKDGRRQTVVLRPHGAFELMPPDTDASWAAREGWADMRDGADAPPPLWLRDPRDKFWFEYLKDSRVVYAQLNRVGDKDSETLADFSKRLVAFVEANPVEKLVLDVRLNRGGNGSLLRPLVVGLIKSKVDAPGRLFAVIGRSTWSAAQFLADDLEQYTNAVFVGEPTGSKGNHYGDSRRITLPHSGLTVRVSIYYWQKWHPMDAREWTGPHLAAELTSADYRANQDPALKAILNYAPQRPLAELLDDALAKGGAASASKALREFKADPLNLYRETEAALLTVGSRLLRERKAELAVEIFKLNAEENPRSPVAYTALGEAYFQAGNRELAAKNFERSLELNPKNPDVAERLRQVKK
jgi:hypothetical protein